MNPITIPRKEKKSVHNGPARVLAIVGALVWVFASEWGLPAETSASAARSPKLTGGEPNRVDADDLTEMLQEDDPAPVFLDLLGAVQYWYTFDETGFNRAVGRNP